MGGSQRANIIFVEANTHVKTVGGDGTVNGREDGVVGEVWVVPSGEEDNRALLTGEVRLGNGGRLRGLGFPWGGRLAAGGAGAAAPWEPVRA